MNSFKLENTVCEAVTTLDWMAKELSGLLEGTIDLPEKKSAAARSIGLTLQAERVANQLQRSFYSEAISLIKHG